MAKVEGPGKLFNAAKASDGVTTLLGDNIAPFWLSALVESADDAIVSKTITGIITSWNKGAERIFGYTADEVIGQPVLIIIPPELHGEERVILSKIRAGERVEHYETVRRRKDGRLIDISLTVSPIRDGDGNIIGASKIARDITHLKRAEKRLQASERRYRTLFDLVPVAVYTCDVEGVIQEFNSRAIELWGREPRKDHDSEKYCGSFKIYYPDGRYMPLEHCPMARVLRGEILDPGDLEIIVERPDGVRRSIIVNPQPLHDEFGNLSGAINCLYDITDRKEAESVREYLLGREKILRQQAEEANRLKDEFLATVSHELRTPLNSILGWVVMVRESNFDVEMIRRAFEVVERNARNQNQIISDILDVSRIITGKLILNLKPISLSQIVQSAADTVRPAIQAKNIDFEIDLEPDREEFVGDADRLQQICWNLLSNAVKFTPSGGHVKTSLRYGDDSAEIQVTDTGQGIEPEFLPFVFDRFRQADSTRNRKHGGLGLGLSIVRHLVELHGGSVSVESEGPDQGAVFTIRLPLKQAAAALTGGNSRRAKARRKDLPAAAAAPSGSLRGLSILVVDDEKDSLELAQFILNQGGAQVFVARSADEAAEIFQREKVDVLVSDIGMPEKDGFELIRQIRNLTNRRPQCIPSIALTAYARDEDRREAAKAGYQAFLPKPVEPADLVQTILQLTSGDRK